MSTNFPFELVRPIGHGSYAKVWLVAHEITGQPYALKVLDEQGNEAEQREERVREVRLVARSVHPNILRVFGTGTMPVDLSNDKVVVAKRGQQYLLTEYATGGALGEKRRLYPWPDARRIIRDILFGLGRVHARGIVHLDLKPANILRCERGYVVADFGIARASQMTPDDDHQRTFRGTPNYMAPEQISAKNYLYGPWTDLYAVGCLAHFLITGKPPFVRKTLMDLLVAHQRDPFPAHEGRYDVPNGFDAWINRLTTKAWNQRFQRASEALRYLDNLTELTVKSRTTSWHAPTSTSPESTDERTLLSPTPVFTEPNQQALTGLPSVNLAHLSFTIDAADGLSPQPKPQFGANLVAFEDCQLVGRTAEQIELWKVYQESVTNQQSQIVKIRAPAGLGKTSLADWFTTRAHETTDAEIFWLTHHPVPGPCDGLAGFLRSYFSLYGRPSETYTKQIAARLACPEDTPLCEELSLLAELDATGASTMDRSMFMSMEQRHAAIKDLMAYLAERRPLVIVVDDAQWAFDTTRLILEYAHTSGMPPVMVVATIREGARDADARALASLRGLTQIMKVKSIELAPLPNHIVADWLKQSMGISKAHIQQLSRTVRGNPLSMKALLFTALSSGTADSIDGHDTLLALMKKRYRLWAQGASKNEQLALEVLAVLGQRATASEWRGFLENFDVILDTSGLESAINAHLVEIGDNQYLSFRHGVFAEVIRLELKRRGVFEKFNERAAHFLNDETALNHERIAFHFRQARRYLDAAKHFFEAAVWHRDRSDYENLPQALHQAAHCLRHARVPRTDWRWTRLSIFWSLGWRVSGYPNRVSRRIERLCKEASTREAEKWSAFLFMEKSRLQKALGQLDEIIPTLRVAVSMAEECNELITMSQIRLELVDRLLEEEALSDARTQLDMLDDEAIWKAWSNNDYQVMYRLQYFKRWSILHRLSGQFDDALDYARRSMALADTHPSKSTKAEIHHQLALAFSRLGNASEASKNIDAGIAYLRGIESSSVVVLQLDALLFLCRQNRLTEARSYLTHFAHLTDFESDGIAASVKLITLWLNLDASTDDSIEALIEHARMMMEKIRFDIQVADSLELMIPWAIQGEFNDFARACCERLRGYLGTATYAFRMKQINQFEHALGKNDELS